MTVTHLDAAQTITRAFNESLYAYQVQSVSGSFVTVQFDSLQVTYTSATIETYQFFTGGLSGTLVATLTVTYTDSTKANLSSVVRT